MQKIILFYIFTPILDPEVVKLWQLSLVSSLELRGRMIVSPHGINGTFGGTIDALKNYIKANKKYAAFTPIHYKWSDGTKEDFPRLSIKVRPEIVAFDAGDELKVTCDGVVGGGTHLTPRKLHELVESKNENGKKVVFFDGRNSHEAAIGKFKNAIVPDVHTSRDFIRELDSGTYDDLKDTPIVTYCTGGIRCEILSSLMKNRGFNDVYQLDGGIATYGEQYGDDGLWEGSLRVFDNRMTIDFSNHAKIIGECYHCQAPTNNYENCARAECNDLVLICENCTHTPELLYHTAACQPSNQAVQTI